jgi:GAF domain-containing protein
MDTPHDVRLSEALTSLAVALLNDKTLKGSLERLARLACRLVPDCSGASISMLIEGEPSTVATTDTVTLELDIAQYDGDDGPCIRALGGEMIRIGYMPDDERFPHFARGAADRRVLSVLSTPAIDHGSVVGSLNMYSRRANGFDDEAEAVALIMAAEVAHALAKSAVLATARATRDRLQEEHDEHVLVSRAQGVVMALHDCSVSQADDLIRNAAGLNGERLVTTAQRILSTVTSDAPVEEPSSRPT